MTTEANAIANRDLLTELCNSLCQKAKAHLVSSIPCQSQTCICGMQFRVVVKYITPLQWQTF